MRKIIAIVCFLLFLFSLPALITALRNTADASALIAQAVVSLLVLTLGIHFWKTPSQKKE